MLTRMLRDKLREAMDDTPVVFVAGSRQTGKSTLVQGVQANLPNAVYQTMDDVALRGPDVSRTDGITMGRW